jgi:hypothetical protein
MPDQVQEPQVPVWDIGADKQVFVPASEAEAGIKAGRFNRQANTVATTSAAGGQTIVRRPSQAAGEHQVSNLEATNKVDQAARLHSFDGILAGAEVAVDSLFDAASMGLLHEHGEVAELKHK